MAPDKRNPVVRLPSSRVNSASVILPKKPLRRSYVGATVLSGKESRGSGTDLRRVMRVRLEEKRGGVFDRFTLTLSTGAYGKVLAIMLIPMLFIQPLLPAYAADEEAALPPEIVDAVEATAPAESVPGPVAEETVSAPNEEVSQDAVETSAIIDESSAPAAEEPTPEDVELASVEDIAEEVSQDAGATSAIIDESSAPAVSPESEAAVAGEHITEEVMNVESAPDEIIVEQTPAPEEVPTLSNSADVSSQVSNTDSDTPGDTATHDGDQESLRSVADATSDVVSEDGAGEIGSPPTYAEPSASTPQSGTVDSAMSASPQDLSTETGSDNTPNTGTNSTEGTVEEALPAATIDGSVTPDIPDADVVLSEDAPPSEEFVTATSTNEEEVRNALKKEVAEEFLRGCISFEHTGYYCLPDGSPTPESDAGAGVARVAVGAEPGTGGYKQIVVTKDGVRTELTHENWDNAFPTQDISGKYFVWQGMKGGRWQIFFGDLTDPESPRILQVTDSRESNFNPKVEGDHLIWQGWVDENWEIFLATRREVASPFASEHLPEGNRLLGVGPEWSVERLTTNESHDMFPSLHGDIVTWQAREGESWVVYAYSIAERTKTKLSSDGAKSENPRFAITWEERDGEGGARLMSYDLSTGKKTNLTDESKKVSSDPFREKFPSPVSQPNQATLPGTATTTGTSTPARGDDDGGGTNSFLP